MCTGAKVVRCKWGRLGNAEDRYPGLLIVASTFPWNQTDTASGPSADSASKLTQYFTYLLF